MITGTTMYKRAPTGFFIITVQYWGHIPYVESAFCSPVDLIGASLRQMESSIFIIGIVVQYCS